VETWTGNEDLTTAGFIFAELLRPSMVTLTFLPLLKKNKVFIQIRSLGL